MNKNAKKIKQANALWSEVIKLIYPCCVFREFGGCGHIRGGDEAHHIIPCRFKMYRWNPLNGIRVCPAHHDWIHANPKAAAERILAVVPDAVRDMIESATHEIYTGRVEDEIITLRNLIKILKS